MLSFVQHQLFISCVYIPNFGKCSLESVHVSRGSDPPEYLRVAKALIGIVRLPPHIVVVAKGFLHNTEALGAK
jgi:hypothetical protein